MIRSIKQHLYGLASFSIIIMNLLSSPIISLSESPSKFQVIKNILTLDSSIRAAQNRIKLCKVKDDKKQGKAKMQQRLINEIQLAKNKAKEDRLRNEQEFRKQQLNINKLRKKNQETQSLHRSRVLEAANQIILHKKSEHLRAKEMSQVILKRIQNQKQSFLNSNRQKRNQMFSASLKAKERTKKYQEQRLKNIKEEGLKQSKALVSKRANKMSELNSLEEIENQLVEKMRGNSAFSAGSTTRSKLSVHSSYRRGRYDINTISQIFMSDNFQSDIQL